MFQFWLSQTLNTVPCLIRNSALLVYFIYSIVHLLILSVNPNLSLRLPSPLVTISLFTMSVGFCFVDRFIHVILLDSTYEWHHIILVIVWLISLSMIMSRSIHVAIKCIISFFLRVSNIPLYIYKTSLSRGKKKKRKTIIRKDTSTPMFTAALFYKSQDTEANWSVHRQTNG